MQNNGSILINKKYALSYLLRCGKYFNNKVLKLKASFVDLILGPVHYAKNNNLFYQTQQSNFPSVALQSIDKKINYLQRFPRRKFLFKLDRWLAPLKK